MSNQLTDPPGKITYGPLDNCFPIFTRTFFYYTVFFHGSFVFNHVKLDRKGFNYTTSEVNI